MRIPELVKTYRLLSDPDAPPWNVKFAGAVALLAAVAAGAAGLYVLTMDDSGVAPGGSVGATGPGAEDGPLLTTYVGAPPETPLTGSAAADAALEAWKAEHPNAVIVSQVAVPSSAGGVAGYELTYRE